MPDPRRQSVRSVEVGIAVLRALADAGGEAGLSALAARAGMPGAKAHRYLRSLVATGLVEQDPGTARYQLGPEALRIGLAALGRLDVARVAAPHLAALRDAVGHSCFLAVPGNAGPAVVRIEQPAESITVNVRLGSVLPPGRSATGQILAAFASPPDPDLEAVRRQGSASVRGSMMPGVNAVAAPVRDHEGRLAAVVTALGPDPGFDPDPEAAPARAVRAAAAAIERALGRD